MKPIHQYFCCHKILYANIIIDTVYMFALGLCVLSTYVYVCCAWKNTLHCNYYTPSILAVGYEARKYGVGRMLRGDEAKQKCPDIIIFHVPEKRGKADLTKYRMAGAEVINGIIIACINYICMYVCMHVHSVLLY